MPKVKVLTTIPAGRYLPVVAQYARANALPFCKLHDRRKAIARYNRTAERLN